MSILEIILYYVPVTLVSCLVYAAVKRDDPGEIARVALKYFGMFTLLIGGLVLVLRLVAVVFGP